MSGKKMSDDEKIKILNEPSSYQTFVIDKLLNIEHRISMIEGGAKVKGAIWGGLTSLVVAIIAALVK